MNCQGNGLERRSVYLYEASVVDRLNHERAQPAAHGFINRTPTSEHHRYIWIERTASFVQILYD
jgi:hypothetical protein